MTLLGLTALLFATAPQIDAASGSVDLNSMTCEQLKAEGDRHLAIMMYGPDPEGAKRGEEQLSRGMTNLGRSQGAQGALMGVAQVVGGVLGGAGAAIGVDAANKAATAANMAKRAEIMDRANDLHASDAKAQDASGDMFDAIAEEYRQRGCESSADIQAAPPQVEGAGSGATAETPNAGAIDKLTEDLLEDFEEDRRKKQGIYGGRSE